MYSVAVAALPGGRGDGQPITSLIDLQAGSQPAHYHAGALADLLLLANSGGFGLLARVADMVARNRGGKAFLSVADTDAVLAPARVLAAHDRVACLSLSGRLLVFGRDELKLQANGGKGLTLMEVDTSDPLIATAGFGAQLRISGHGRAGKAKDEVLKGAALVEHEGRRARKGRKLAGFVKPRQLAPLD